MNFNFLFRNFFTAFILITTIITSKQSAAQSNYEDVVYLKNGNIIHGIIIEQIPNETIKIKSGENIFVFRMDEVSKMTKEEVKLPESEKPSSIKKERKKKGYANSTELIVSRGIKDESTENQYGDIIFSHYNEINNYPSVGFQTVNGYLFSPKVFMGAGIGMHFYRELVLVPLFLDAQINFSEKKVTPFVDVAVGGSFPIQFPTFSDYGDKGGFMGSWTVGLKIFVTPRSAINFSLGFHAQEIGIKNIYVNGDYHDDSYTAKQINRIILRTGFTF